MKEASELEAKSQTQGMRYDVNMFFLEGGGGGGG